MKPALGLRASVLVLLLLAPRSAGAQYIYLDSNGDGVHTAADVLHGTGPTVADIWLDTGHNRDGTATACRTDPSEDLSMFMYLFSLEATGGTVTYANYTNRIEQMGLQSIGRADATQFQSGSFYAPVGTNLAAGRYLLGSLTLAVTSGEPTVRFIGTMTWMNPFDLSYTMFGSSCKQSLENPNSLILETEWFDADGLAFAPGGSGNQSPVLGAPADMAVAAGENAFQSLSATDADHQSLTFSKASGPSFLYVFTTNPGAGTASGEIRLAPSSRDLGTATGVVSVTDGVALTSASLTITVVAGPPHRPILYPLPELVVIAGGVRRQIVAGADADGSPLHFAKVAGPNYASVRDLATRMGGGTAALTLSPSLCDVGSAIATLSVSDGTSAAQRDLRLRVLPASALPDSVPLQTTDNGSVASMGLADLNMDGKLDLVVTHQGQAWISTFLGRGDGTFGPAASIPSERFTASPTFADFDRDGVPDLAVANSASSSVGVFHGKGDGTFDPPATYPTGNGSSGLATADMNRDGILDLITVDRNDGTVSVLLGTGTGSFGARRSAPAGIQPTSIVVADFNLDGRLDVAVANATLGSFNPSLTVVLGLGDGSMEDPLQIPIAARGIPMFLTAGDWNWDGLTDLAVTDFFFSNVLTFAGRGDGSFEAPVTLPRFQIPLVWECAAEDLNSDGNTDLVVADTELNRLIVYLGNGLGGFAAPTALRTPAIGGGALALALGDLNSDGRPDLVTAENMNITIFLNRFGSGIIAAEARAFARDDKKVKLTGEGRGLEVRLEPVHGSYANDQVDLASITLRSEGTGSVSEIHAITPRSMIVGDLDRNGVAELGVTFARSDLAALFSLVDKDQSAITEMTGALLDGRRFCAAVELNVNKAKPPHDVAFAPNPLNPRSKLTFSTTRTGAAKVQLFDIQGRLVRTLLDVPRLEAGDHEVAFDGKSARGTALSSGMLFYRLTSVDGTFQGRVLILK